MKPTKLLVLPVLAVLAVLLLASLSTAQADTPTTILVAIPTNVDVVAGDTTIVVIRHVNSVSLVTCVPGGYQPLTVVVTGEGRDSPGEVTGVFALHDHAIPLGSRYLITDDPPAPCGDFWGYTATLIN